MPATQSRPELVDNVDGTKIQRFKSSITDERPTLVCYAIIASVHLFNIATIGKLQQASVGVLLAYSKVFRNNGWALDRQRLTFGERRKDPVVCVCHPVGFIPEVHGLVGQLHTFGLAYVNYRNSLITNHFLVIKYKWLTERRIAKRGSRPRRKAAGCWDPPTVLDEPACPSTTPRVLKTRKITPANSFQSTSTLATASAAPTTTRRSASSSGVTSMSCERCGAPCHGPRCASCKEVDSNEARDDGQTAVWYDCRECGKSAAEPNGLCFRCRGDDA